MLIRATIGFALLVGFLVLGASVARQRSAGRMPWRRLAGSVDRTIGMVAVALLAVLVFALVRLAF